MSSCDLSPEKKIELASLTLYALDLIINTLRTHGEVYVSTREDAEIPCLAELVLEQLSKDSKCSS